MSLQGLDRRQVIQLHERYGWPAERIAQELGFEVEAVALAIPKPFQELMLDQLAESPEGILPMGEATVWAVAASNPEVDGFYLVLQLSIDHRICTCKGFRFRSRCKHVAMNLA